MYLFHRPYWLSLVSVAFCQTWAIAAPPISTNQVAPVWPVKSVRDEFVIWRAEIGSYSGTPVVVSGRVLVGTNNEHPQEKRVTDDRGVLMCFDEEGGKFLWQTTHKRLPDRANDMPTLGLLGRACIDGTKVYYQTNRGELVCSELGKKLGVTDADPVWKVDMVGDLKVFKRDAGDHGNLIPTPLVVGDLVYCVTGNGSIYGYEHVFKDVPFVPQPDAPSFLAVNKSTGKIAWSSPGPGTDIAYGQWGSPAAVTIGKEIRIVFPAGDGCLYLFEALKGKLLGKIACTPKPSLKWGRRERGDSLFPVGAPVIIGKMAYLSMGQDQEGGNDIGAPILAVDLSKVQETPQLAIAWSYTDKSFDGVVDRVAATDDFVYALSRSGLLVTLDRATGKKLWEFNLGTGSRFGAPLVHENKVYVPSGCELVVFQAGAKLKMLGYYDFTNTLMGTPAKSGKNLIVATGKYLWCIRTLQE